MSMGGRTWQARRANPAQVWLASQGQYGSREKAHPPHRRPMPASCYCSDKKRWSHAKIKKRDEKEKKKNSNTGRGSEIV